VGLRVWRVMAEQSRSCRCTTSHRGAFRERSGWTWAGSSGPRDGSEPCGGRVRWSTLSTGSEPGGSKRRRYRPITLPVQLAGRARNEHGYTMLIDRMKPSSTRSADRARTISIIQGRHPCLSSNSPSN
jgi:hypothetical protein